MTKQDIIAAAFKVWGRKLYLTTSLADIAAELGVSKPALYRHFKNKQALLNEMFTFFFDEYSSGIREGFERAASVQGTLESMLIMCRVLTRYYALHLDYFVFAMTKVYGNKGAGNMASQLMARGIDLRIFRGFGCQGGHPV